jgi:hypothetical protein
MPNTNELPQLKATISKLQQQVGVIANILQHYEERDYATDDKKKTNIKLEIAQELQFLDRLVKENT